MSSFTPAAQLALAAAVAAPGTGLAGTLRTVHRAGVPDARGRRNTSTYLRTYRQDMRRAVATQTLLDPDALADADYAASLPARPVHPAGCGPACAGFCLIDGVPCEQDPGAAKPGACPGCGVPDGRPCAFSCSIAGAQFEDA